MKKILILLLALSVVLPATAQVIIPNAGFESWSILNSFDDPADWENMNTMLAPNDPPFVTRSTDAVAGNAAIAMFTRQMGSFFVPGQVAGYFPTTARPVALTGVFKYLPAGPDTCRIVAMLVISDTIAQTDSIVGYGSFRSAGNGNMYMPFIAPIQYSSPATPNQIRIYMIPGYNPQFPGSELRVDNLAAPMSVTGIAESKDVPAALSVYPNPTTGKLHLTLPAHTISPFEVTVSNTLGKTVFRETFARIEPAGSLPLHLENLATGVYLVQVSENEKRYSTRLVISR